MKWHLEILLSLVTALYLLIMLNKTIWKQEYESIGINTAIGSAPQRTGFCTRRVAMYSQYANPYLAGFPILQSLDDKEIISHENLVE